MNKTEKTEAELLAEQVLEDAKKEKKWFNF